jgi:hypothetical protein
VWDAKYRRKAARVMERSGAVLMSCEEEMTAEKCGKANNGGEFFAQV